VQQNTRSNAIEVDSSECIAEWL